MENENDISIEGLLKRSDIAELFEAASELAGNSTGAVVIMFDKDGMKFFTTPDIPDAKVIYALETLKYLILKGEQ